MHLVTVTNKRINDKKHTDKDPYGHNDMLTDKSESMRVGEVGISTDQAKPQYTHHFNHQQNSSAHRMDETRIVPDRIDDNENRGNEQNIGEQQ